MQKCEDAKLEVYGRYAMIVRLQCIVTLQLFLFYRLVTLVIHRKLFGIMWFERTTLYKKGTLI